MADAGAEIGDDEELYRRVLPIDVSPGDRRPSPKAFKPNAHDTDGISLFRAALCRRAELWPRSKPKPYYVVSLRARDVRELGLTIVRADLVELAGHVVLPQLNYAERNSIRAQEWAVQLAERLCFDLVGPLDPPATPGGVW